MVLSGRYLECRCLGKLTCPIRSASSRLIFANSSETSSNRNNSSTRATNTEHSAMKLTLQQWSLYSGHLRWTCLTGLRRRGSTFTTMVVSRPSIKFPKVRWKVQSDACEDMTRHSSLTSFGECSSGCRKGDVLRNSCWIIPGSQVD